MIKIAAVLVSAAMGAGALFGFIATVTTATNSHLSRTGVYCPEEDSCTPHYDGVTNRWTVTRP